MSTSSNVAIEVGTAVIPVSVLLRYLALPFVVSVTAKRPFTIGVLKDKLKKNLSINQSVVTNCSKERPGSIVTKTLKNGILILIHTSTELDFYDDFKYISLVKFTVTYQKVTSLSKFALFWKIGENTP